jgi:hypothetical protein
MEHILFHECHDEPRLIVEVLLEEMLDWYHAGGCEVCHSTELVHVPRDRDE